MNRSQTWISGDTAPAGLAEQRSAAAAPATIAVFAVLCAGITPCLAALAARYAEALASLTGVPAATLLEPAGSLSFRPLVALLLGVIALASPGEWTARWRLAGVSAVVYATVVLLVDVAWAILQPPLAPSPLSDAGGIVSFLVGVVVLGVAIFRFRRLPAGVRVTTRRPTSRTGAVVLAVCVAGSLTAVAGWSFISDRFLHLGHVRFNGWLHEDVVLFAVVFVCHLWAVSALERRAKPRRGPELSVAFLVPAHDEAHAVGECIASLDGAAARHRGLCTVYVVDNASRDGTAAVASAALTGCHRLRGRVLSCPTPGKGKALNFGLSHVTEDIVVRVDADTVVDPALLAAITPWFWDRSVGGVGGFPLPKPDGPRWLQTMRLVEVTAAIAFFRVAQSALDGTTVMPGSIAAYRRGLLVELGGFGQGFNGEDSDITMRIGRLGYRIVTDPGVRVWTECPGTLAQLREQRQRWTRGRFHMASRNRSCVTMRQGVRGVWMLPASLFTACRRCLMVPLLAGATVVEMLDPGVFSLREVFAVVRILAGFQVAVAIAVLVAHRQYRALPYVPLTLGYRLFLAYVAFETVLTLVVTPRRRSALSSPAVSLAPRLQPAVAMNPRGGRS